MKKILFICLLPFISSCIHGRYVKDVDFPATPLDMTKITKKGKACFGGTFVISGNGSIIEAAKNGGLKKVYIVEYGKEYKNVGLTELNCTYVYGE